MCSHTTTAYGGGSGDPACQFLDVCRKDTLIRIIHHSTWNYPAIRIIASF